MVSARSQPDTLKKALPESGPGLTLSHVVRGARIGQGDGIFRSQGRAGVATLIAPMENNETTPSQDRAGGALTVADHVRGPWAHRPDRAQIQLWHRSNEERAGDSKHP
jgi:hypothetical protein